MELNVKEIEKDINLITLSGELDMYTSPSLKEFVDNADNRSVDTYIIDCEDLTYLDSSGVSTMIYTYSKFHKRRLGLWFININGSVRKVIELTKLEGFLPISDSLEAVFEKIKKKGIRNDSRPKKEIIIDGNHDLFHKVGMIPAEFPSDFKRIRYFTSLIVQRAPAEIRDFNILEQQVSELIKNAVKHGNQRDQSKKVKVWFSFSKYHAHLIVQDEGPGFLEIEQWNEFYGKRIECFETHNFEEMVKYVTYTSSISDESDGGNAMFAAVEYWNCGVIFNENRNCVAVRRDFSIAGERTGD
jgi:serine/threonine-protein kinase RsbW